MLGNEPNVDKRKSRDIVNVGIRDPKMKNKNHTEQNVILKLKILIVHF